ncbi:MAG: hypothetical protein ACI8WB_002710 [Phenylobacterium sp.]|jgi:hypothetical protein
MDMGLEMTKSKLSAVIATGSLILASMSLQVMAEQTIEQAVAEQNAQMKAQLMPLKIHAQTLQGFQSLNHNMANNYIRGAMTLTADVSSVDNDSELNDIDNEGHVELAHVELSHSKPSHVELSRETAAVE